MSSETIVIRPSIYNISSYEDGSLTTCGSYRLDNNEKEEIKEIKSILKKSDEAKAKRLLKKESEKRNKFEEFDRKKHREAKIKFKTPLEEIFIIESYKQYNTDVSEMYFFMGVSCGCKRTCTII